VIDIKVGIVDHDFELVDGDLVLVDGVDSYAQGVRIRLAFMAGEWFKDTRSGAIDMREETDSDLMIGRIREEIMLEYGAVRISKFETAIDNEKRSLKVFFEVETIWGNYSGEETAGL